MELQAFPIDEVTGRHLRLLAVAALGDVPKQLVLPSQRFVCLVALDAVNSSKTELAALANILVSSGAVYVCAWGPGCEAVEIAVDLEDIGRNLPLIPARAIVTTSHVDESLDDAIWFALNTAWPDEEYEAECESVLALVIGNPSWARSVQIAFENPRRLTATVLSNEERNAD